MNKKTRKETLGFEPSGSVKIVRGDIVTYDNFLRSSDARYCTMWGWYFPSDKKVPFNFPENLTLIELNWDQIATNPNELKSDKEIQSIINQGLYKEAPSEFYGKEGERPTLSLKVVRNLPIASKYHSRMHIFEDENKNEFVWITAAKDIPEGKTVTLTGTIKAHNIYTNEKTLTRTKQTILTRCKIK